VLDASLRLATARVLLEFLQMFGVLFNVTWSWKIQKDLWWVVATAAASVIWMVCTQAAPLKHLLMFCYGLAANLCGQLVSSSSWAALR
jgi:hypothetical protein